MGIDSDLEKSRVKPFGDFTTKWEDVEIFLAETVWEFNLRNHHHKEGVIPEENHQTYVKNRDIYSAQMNVVFYQQL